MTWRIAATGTVSLDDVTTPSGRRDEQLGGSAVYFTLAAVRYAPVVVCAAVGRDGIGRLRGAMSGIRGADIAGIDVLDAPTRRWRAVHDTGSSVTADEETEPGAAAAWNAQLSERARDAECLFLGSMSLQHQSAVLEQTRATVIGYDTMLSFIREDRRRVLQLASRCDFVFLNRRELAALCDADEADWRDAAAKLCAESRVRAVVVKAGAAGAALVTRTDAILRSPAGIGCVVDPTGAGDAVAGGFMGAMAMNQRDDDAFLLDALEEGLACAADAVTAFGIADLAASTRARSSSAARR